MDQRLVPAHKPRLDLLKIKLLLVVINPLRLFHLNLLTLHLIQVYALELRMLNLWNQVCGCIIFPSFLISLLFWRFQLFLRFLVFHYLSLNIAHQVILKRHIRRWHLWWKERRLRNCVSVIYRIISRPHALLLRGLRTRVLNIVAQKLLLHRNDSRIAIIPLLRRPYIAEKYLLGSILRILLHRLLLGQVLWGWLFLSYNLKRLGS